MSSPEGGPARLGKFVKQRRAELRLSQATAAKVAKISRPVWANIENGAGISYDHTYAGVDEALRWSPGSSLRILEGGEPKLAEPDAGPMSGEDQMLLVIAAAENPAIDWGDEDTREFVRRRASAVLERMREEKRKSRGVG